MLDDFMNSQVLAYKIINGSVINNRLSHAYLVETNGCDRAYDFVKAFVKTIICPKHYTNNKLCRDCSICRRIEDNNYTEFKVIDTDGMWLKKEQVIDLQMDFSTVGIEGGMRVYVIKNCEKMNASTSNSLLKFLEEPNPNIIAILMVNNIESLLDTIISRCQLIKLIPNYGYNNSLDKVMYLICDGKDDLICFVVDNNIVDIVFNFINVVSKNKYDGIVNANMLWHKYIQKREELAVATDIIIYIYYDCLKYLVGYNDLFFDDRIEDIRNIINNRSIESILNIIEKLDDLRLLIKYNVNINLFVDKLCMVLGG
jgi:DNA polymerase III subunit delta'